MKQLICLLDVFPADFPQGLCGLPRFIRWDISKPLYFSPMFKPGVLGEDEFYRGEYRDPRGRGENRESGRKPNQGKLIEHVSFPGN